jgi:hypothetical protein
LFIDVRRFLDSAGEIFSTRHAFEEVHLTDRRPGSRLNAENTYEYNWVNDEYARQSEYQAYLSRFEIPLYPGQSIGWSNVIPGVIFRFLPADLATETGAAIYRTSEDKAAIAALSRASTAYGEFQTRTTRFKQFTTDW